MFCEAAKWVISYATGTPSNENWLLDVAKFANRPKRYSVFNSWPENVRVISTRPWTSGARREELMDCAWRVRSVNEGMCGPSGEKIFYLPEQYWQER